MALDIYKEKRITGLCLYAVAASIHPSVIALIGLRYIQFLRNRVIRVLIGVALALWSSGIEGIIALLSPFASISAVNVILGKLSYYSLVSGTTDNFGDTDGAVLASRECDDISEAIGTGSREGVFGRALYGKNHTG